MEDQAPASFTFKDKVYVLPKLNQEAFLRAVFDKLRSLQFDPLEVAIRRYDELKSKPELLDRLFAQAKETAKRNPSREEAGNFMASFDGRTWTLWWMLSGKYPELTLADAEEIVVAEAAARAQAIIKAEEAAKAKAQSEAIAKAQEDAKARAELAKESA